jgi:hypothetical protein
MILDIKYCELIEKSILDKFLIPLTSISKENEDDSKTHLLHLIGFKLNKFILIIYEYNKFIK